MSEYRKLTQAELVAEAEERFGKDWLDWAFTCPSCGDVATFRDFKQTGAGAALCGQHCIGRHLGALNKHSNRPNRKKDRRGCDWTAYGLIRGPWEVVVPADEHGPERSIWSFPLATAEELAAAEQAAEPKQPVEVAG